MTSPIRVLHVIETGGPGGAEAMLADLVARLDPRRFESRVGLLRGGGWLEDRLSSLGIRPTVLRSGGRLDVSLVRHLRRLLRDERIDLLHSHLMDMNFYSCVAGLVARVPVVATEHGDVHHPAKRGNIHWIKPKTIARLASSWVAVSAFTRDRIVADFGIPAWRVRVIYNGIRMPEPTDAKSVRRALAPLGVPEQAFLVGSVGSLYPVKGHSCLVEALARIVADVPGAHLCIAGRGDEEGPLKQKAAELEILDRVHLLGLRDDVPRLLAAFDVFVLPSLSEGLPLSLLEAMAAGRPVIASRVGGIPEVLEDGVTGFLAEPRDVAALARCLVRVAAMGSAGVEMGLRARRVIESRFTIGAMVSAYQAVYEAVIKTPKSLR